MRLDAGTGAGRCLCADDVIELLPGSRGERPVFHSEADFQQALAWAIHVAHPGLRVRLETRPVKGTHLDLLVTDPTDGGSFAIELKYLTDKWEGEVDGEQFALLRQSAQDIRGYDCVKDIARVEKLMAAGYAKAGLVLILANDPLLLASPHARSSHECGRVSSPRRADPHRPARLGPENRARDER